MGYYVGWSPNDMRHQFASRIKASLAQLFAWFEAGRLKPEVSHCFALDDFQQAMAVVLGRQSIGRVALVMDREAARMNHG
jgi:NADPH2:quinone reductase